MWKATGFDAVWFDICLVLAVKIARITPPVGFNLFVIQGVTGDSLGYIAGAMLPYLLIMIAFVILLTVFPGIVTTMPKLSNQLAK